MQTRQELFLELLRPLIVSALSEHLQHPSRLPATPSMPTIAPIFSTLASTDHNSREFLPILKLFLRSKGEHKLLAQLAGPAAAYVADILDKLSSPPEFYKCTLRLLQSLCRSWGILPTSYTFHGGVTHLDEHPYFHSNSAEVFRGISGGELIAAKALTFCMSDDPSKLNKRLSKEAIVWKRLSHPNVLPFYGVFHRGMRPCLVSPWMLNRNIRDFVTSKPYLNRFKLLVDVCKGLQYLHEQDIVHGDLKGDNVLIDNDCNARLSDFGLTSFDRSRWCGVTSNSSDPGGTIPYMAPELFSRENEMGQPKMPLMRKEVDVYALGMLIYEVLSGKRPFQKLCRETVKLRVFRGERPQRPSTTPIPDPVWEMLQACWNEEPTQRPTVGRVMAMCTAYASQNVLLLWPPMSSPDRSGGTHPSQVTETNSSTSLWCPSPISG